jgi:hypothetical protein
MNDVLGVDRLALAVPVEVRKVGQFAVAVVAMEGGGQPIRAPSRDFDVKASRISCARSITAWFAGVLSSKILRMRNICTRRDSAGTARWRRPGIALTLFLPQVAEVDPCLHSVSR